MALHQSARNVSGNKSRAHINNLMQLYAFLCLKAACEYLDDPRYGEVRQSGTKVGSIATYSCNRGFKLVGDSKRRCQYDGKWSGEEPVCKRCELDGATCISKSQVMLFMSGNFCLSHKQLHLAVNIWMLQITVLSNKPGLILETRQLSPVNEAISWLEMK